MLEVIKRVQQLLGEEMQEKYYTPQETETPLAECDIENITETCLKTMLTSELLCFCFVFFSSIGNPRSLVECTKSYASGYQHLSLSSRGKCQFIEEVPWQ